MKTKIKDVFKKCFCCLKQHIFNILLLIFAVFFGICLLLCCVDRHKTSIEARAEDLSIRSVYVTQSFATNTIKGVDDALKKYIQPNAVSSQQYLLDSFYFTLTFNYSATPSVVLVLAGRGVSLPLAVESADITIVDKFSSSSPNSYTTSYLVAYSGLNLSTLSSYEVYSYSYRYVEYSSSDYPTTLFGISGYKSGIPPSKILYIYEWRFTFESSGRYFVLTFDIPLVLDESLSSKSSSWLTSYPSSGVSDDGYTQGYDDGYIAGGNARYDDGYTQGYDDGQTAGYSKGLSDGLNTTLADITPLQTLSANVSAVLKMELFPGFRLYSIVLISLTCFLIVVLIKSLASL